MKAKNDSLLEIEGEIVSDTVAEDTKRISKITSNAPKSNKTAKRRRSICVKRIETYKKFMSEQQRLQTIVSEFIKLKKEDRNEDDRKIIVYQFVEFMTRFLEFSFTHGLIIRRRLGKKRWDEFDKTYSMDRYCYQHDCFKIMKVAEWEDYFCSCFAFAVRKAGLPLHDSVKSYNFLCV